jgi:hypothetical protein
MKEVSMKIILVLLSVTAILAALFCGGCSVLSVGSYLWHGPRGEYPGLQRDIAWISAGVGLLAVAVLAANIWVLRAIFVRPSLWRSVLAGALAVMDVATAALALSWILWADSWHWVDWPWSWLAKGAAVALGVKGVLVWIVVAGAKAPDGTGVADA